MESSVFSAGNAEDAAFGSYTHSAFLHDTVAARGTIKKLLDKTPRNDNDEMFVQVTKPKNHENRCFFLAIDGIDKAVSWFPSARLDVIGIEGKFIKILQWDIGNELGGRNVGATVEETLQIIKWEFVTAVIHPPIDQPRAGFLHDTMAARGTIQKLLDKTPRNDNDEMFVQVTRPKNFRNRCLFMANDGVDQVVSWLPSEQPNVNNIEGKFMKIKRWNIGTAELEHWIFEWEFVTAVTHPPPIDQPEICRPIEKDNDQEFPQHHPSNWVDAEENDEDDADENEEYILSTPPY